MQLQAAAKKEMEEEELKKLQMMALVEKEKEKMLQQPPPAPSKSTLLSQIAMNVSQTNVQWCWNNAETIARIVILFAPDTFRM